MKNAGLILIVVGLIMVIVTGFSYITREKVVDIGSVEITADERHPVQWSPVVGGLLVASGLVVVLLSKKK